VRAAVAGVGDQIVHLAADDDGGRFHVFLGDLTPCFNFAGVKLVSDKGNF
jgi:hypothetical protein